MERKKRVRFSYDEPEEAEEGDNRPRKLKFPKGKKARGGSDNADEEELRLNARAAATERALKRKSMGEQLRYAEDTSNISDVVEAEEEGSEDEDRMEPFNLNAERRDGYFDDDGNYVEYETKFEARDAWLDSAEIDTRFVSQLTETVSEAPIATPGEVCEMKRRIVELLEPGETVLEALRRLKGPTPKQGRREKLTGEAKLAFDQLTENAMKLMDAGESDVYEKVRETFRREVDAMSKSRNLDMFTDDDTQAATGKSAEDLEGAATSGEAVEEGNGSGTYPGYVFDNSSGYYYNADTGYYYDPGSGLFCAASSGQWYKFDEASSAYVEAV